MKQQSKKRRQSNPKTRGRSPEPSTRVITVINTIPPHDTPISPGFEWNDENGKFTRLMAIWVSGEGGGFGEQKASSSLDTPSEMKSTESPSQKRARLEETI